MKKLWLTARRSHMSKHAATYGDDSYPWATYLNWGN